LHPAEQEKYMEAIFIKNISFRRELIGVIIGQFTIEEYETYLKNASAFNRRMMTILKKRILDSQSEFYLGNSQ
jgi:hypothetical protein